MALDLFYKVVTSAEKTTQPIDPNLPVTHIVFLHGYLAGYTNMIGLPARFAERLAPRPARFYLIDLRNHGASPHSQDISYTAMAEDIEAILHKEGATESILIGHSMGGKVAMTVALRGHAHVNQLIIEDIAPGAYATPFSEKHVKKLVDIDLSQFSSREAVDKYLQESMPNATLRQFFLKNLRVKPPNNETSGNLYWQCNLKTLYEKRHEVIKAVPIPPNNEREASPINISTATDTLTSIAARQKIPTLFIRGEDSPYIDANQAASLKETFPNHKLITYPQTGHWVHFAHPDRFAENCCDFILQSA